MNGELIVTDDVSSAFADAVKEAFDNRANPDNFTLAFGGGSTARKAYTELAKRDIDWTKVTAIWGDERMVPLDHADSNYRIAKEEIFDNVAPLAAVHSIDDSTDADEYDAIVKALGPIDFVHLGMGDDGHTASLFPGSPALESPVDKLVVATGDDLHPHPRITLTFSALNQSRLCVFTATGSNKAEMFKRIQDGEHLPAGLVAAHRVVWLLDSAAAGQ